jgi:hyperosmotically inducible protein
MRNVIVPAMIAVTATWTAGCAVSSGRVGKYLDDGTVTAQVKAKMAEDTAVAASRIEVETLKGVVQLSGFATSDANVRVLPRLPRASKA